MDSGTSPGDEFSSYISGFMLSAWTVWIVHSRPYGCQEIVQKGTQPSQNCSEDYGSLLLCAKRVFL